MKRFLLLFFCLGFAVPVFAAPASEDSPVSVKAEISRAAITIGDPIEYTVSIKYDPSVQILSTVPVPSPDIFKVQKAFDLKGREGEKLLTGRKFTLTAYQLGEFVLDPVKIEYRIGSNANQSIETEKLYITVKSIDGGGEKTDIRGLKLPLLLRGKYLIFMILILLLAAAGAGYAIYRRYQQNLLNPPAPEVVLTPEEEALSNLNQLYDSDLLRRGKIKEYYFRLSEILRVYFEKRFHILAVESTTDEILRDLARNETDPELCKKIAEVLESADLAKFAKWVPEPPQILVLNQKAKQVVETARPKEVQSGV